MVRKKSFFKKIILLIMICLVTTMLSACGVDKEVQNVVDDINRLSKESRENLTEFEEKYNNVLNNYQDLWQEQKDQVDNYDVLQEIGNELEELKQKENEEQMKSYAKDFVDSLPTYNYQLRDRFMVDFNSYYDYLNDAQKTEALLVKAQYDSLDYFIEDTIQYLKNPNSFTLYSGSIQRPLGGDNNEYSITIEIDYGATNDFGGEVENNAWGIVDFSIDIETKSIEITGCTNSSYINSLY